MACERLESDGELIGFCRPFCISDEDCGELHCDRNNGVCTKRDTAEDDFGRPCSPNDDDPTTLDETGCSGVCVQIAANIGICSHRCLYGSSETCGTREDSNGLCAITDEGGTVGDVGYCAELCDSSEDCRHPRVSCDAFESDRVRELVGKAGVCALPNETSGEGEN